MSQLSNDHLLVDLSLLFCRAAGIKPLGAVLQNPHAGEAFCSNEKILGSKDVWRKSRATAVVQVPYMDDGRVVKLEFGTEHFVADTGRLEMSQESIVSMIGVVRSVDPQNIVLRPLIIGAPTYSHFLNKDLNIPETELAWQGWSLYQLYPEDIDEFSMCKNVSVGQKEWQEYMRKTSEEKIKSLFAEILGDEAKKDWGGELNDHYTTSLHLSKKRTSAAFVFKGPSKFREMQPKMLGKNGDQIYRLTKSSARLLIVQHCHEISEAVRETLYSFAVAPPTPRHYCLIDGKDTYRILKAYGKI